MIRLRRPLSLLALALCAQAGAQAVRGCGGSPGWPAWAGSGTFQGTLGPQAVGLRLDRQNSLGTRYVYRRLGLPIDLEPLRDGQRLILQETVRRTFDRRVVTGCFTLTPTPGGLSGQWRRPGGGAAQPVRLRAYDAARQPLKLPPSPELLRLRREDPLNFLRLNRPLRQTGHTLNEGLSGLSYPLSAPVTPGVRAALQDRLLLQAADKLDCRALAPEQSDSGEGFWFDFRATLPFQTARLLGVEENGTAYCGGAHPSLIFAAFTLDRQTGRRFTPTDLWPRLSAARLGTLYLRGFPQSGDLAQCAGELRGDAPELHWTLTRRGLALYSDDFSEASRVCRTRAVTLPYTTLRAEANRASPYFRDVYGR